MATEISQRELRNNSGDIMRRVDAGESFVVTRNGVPVGELTPITRRRWIPADIASAVFSATGKVELARLRDDLDRVTHPGLHIRA